MVDDPIRGSRRGSWIAVLALLIGCTSSSVTRPVTDGDEDVDAGGASDGTPEGDLAMADVSTDVDDAQGDVPGEGGAGSDGGQDDAVTDHDLCTAGCMLTAAVMACPEPFAACTKRCDLVFSRGVCLAALRTLAQCQIAAGPEAYECVASGGLTTKPGVCAAENKAKADCVSGDAGM